MSTLLLVYFVTCELVQATTWSGPQDRHLVSCLTIIGNRHFPSDRALAISLPASGASYDIEVSLLADLLNDRPIVIFLSRNDSNSHNGTAAQKVGSYIIITSN